MYSLSSSAHGRERVTCQGAWNPMQPFKRRKTSLILTKHWRCMLISGFNYYYVLMSWFFFFKDTLR